MSQVPNRKQRREHTKGKGDLSRKSTHKMRTNMGMGLREESSGGGGTLGSMLRNLITGKDKEKK